MKKLFFLLLVCVTTNLYAVPVKYTCDIPFWWNRTPINAQCGDTLYRSKEKARLALDRFLKKYPKRVIRKNLKRVVFVRYIELYGVEYGATYEYNVLYISTDRNSNSVKDLEEKLHHEFSSVLMDNHNFKSKRWKSISKRYVSEDDYGRSHVGDKDAFRGSKSLYKKGFVVKYGSTDMENDVNTYAEFLFVSPKRLKSIAKRYEKVYHKTRLLKDFYCSIDKNFKFCGE